MLLSAIVPAFNEEMHLGETLQQIRRSTDVLREHDAELIVVDNASTDRTAGVAASAGARVVFEPVQNIARARNRGAAASAGDVLVFIDADTLVPETAFSRIAATMNATSCAGGAFDVRYERGSAVIRAYLAFWKLAGIALGMGQGAAQFCRRDAFVTLGGYDETLFMGEDVDFHWRLKRYARRNGLTVERVSDAPVASWARRFDQWPVWKTLVWTNPLVALFLRRRRRVWRGWYDDPPR